MNVGDDYLLTTESCYAKNIVLKNSILIFARSICRINEQSNKTKLLLEPSINLLPFIVIFIVTADRTQLLHVIVAGAKADTMKSGCNVKKG